MDWLGIPRHGLEREEAKQPGKSLTRLLLEEEMLKLSSAVHLPEKRNTSNNQKGLGGREGKRHGMSLHRGVLGSRIAGLREAWSFLPIRLKTTPQECPRPVSLLCTGSLQQLV